MQYTLASTGELIPLLHVAPSKTDRERLLVIGPELADVLAAIVTRIRTDAGAVPLVAAYDYHEKIWNPPMPLLFQRHYGGERRPITPPAIRRLLNWALAKTGFTDNSGQPLRFLPHDFRRIFITDAVMNGMPPHIAQLVVGHGDINTTMGYKAVYPEEVINGHRAFIARRRQLRPGEEYRTPTDAEWDEFLGHFERRKVALGSCGRAYNTPCIHEHSCLRCPLLRPDPAHRTRLVEVRDNLLAGIAEARQHRWLGEVDGLTISLAGAEQKLAQLDELATRAHRAPGNAAPHRPRRTRTHRGNLAAPIAGKNPARLVQRTPAAELVPVRLQTGLVRARQRPQTGLHRGVGAGRAGRLRRVRRHLAAALPGHHQTLGERVGRVRAVPAVRHRNPHRGVHDKQHRYLE
jgi:hypothetical protein